MTGVQRHKKGKAFYAKFDHVAWYVGTETKPLSCEAILFSKDERQNEIKSR